MENRKKFQLINGCQPLPSRVVGDHSPQAVLPSRDREESLIHYHSKPGNYDLMIALKAAEHRLSKVLEDRNRIARDLHDGILQSLYAIGLHLEASLQTSIHQLAEAKPASDLVVDQINHLIHEVRRMIRGLEEGIVQEFDLAFELLNLSAFYEQAGRLRISLDLQPNAIDVLTTEEEQEILNIVREALSNCARHAEATQVTVSVCLHETTIRVSISDNGIGFVTTDGQPRGYGLANMNTRARKLGGTLHVHSTRGRGTHIVAEFSVGPVPISL